MDHDPVRLLRRSDLQYLSNTIATQVLAAAVLLDDMLWQDPPAKMLRLDQVLGRLGLEGGALVSLLVGAHP